MQVELWELKPGDELDFHVVWARELRDGRRIASQSWQVVSPAGALDIVAQGQNAVQREFQGETYPIGSVTSIWLRVATAKVGDFVKVTSTIVTDHTQPQTITATRWLEVVQLYSHERQDPPRVRTLAELGLVA